MPGSAASILHAAALLALLLTVPGLSAEPASDEPDTPTVISGIGERMGQFVQDREIAGAVTLVATPDRIVHLEATGKADIARADPCDRTPSSGSRR